MKLFNSFFVFVILCGAMKLCFGEDLKCKFKDVSYDLYSTLYSCFVKSLVNTNNNMIVNGSSGIHMINKYDYDVKGIWILDTSTKFIPVNLGLVFNITALRMWNTQLIEIKSIDFKGMQELEYFELFKNELTSLLVDVFSTLTKLRYISLASNKIENLPLGLFDNNSNLEEIRLWGNKIQFIGSGLFDNLKKLKIVNLNVNICINKHYEGATTITQLRHDIKANCMHPNEVTVTNTITQNPMEVQRIEFEEKINNLEKELFEAKDTIKKEQQEKVKAKNECVIMTQEFHQCEANLQNFVSSMSIRTCQGLNSFDINCDFKKQSNEYSCSTQSLIINQRDMVIKEVNGKHFILKSNANVTLLIVTNSTVSFWSNNIFNTFPALESLYIHNSQLKELIKGDFSFATNLNILEVHGNEIRNLGNQVFEGAEEHLTEIELNSNQIETILINTFQGLKQLKELSLKNNLISELQSETFKDLINLKILNCASNKLQILDGKFLQFNTKLQHLYLQQNNINGIGEDILNYSPILKTVDLSDNKCIDLKATKKDGDLDNIVDDIKTHCNLFENCDYWSSIFEILI